MPADSHRAPSVALISLEPWDEVWRRNQHLAAELVSQGVVGSLLFVNPPTTSKQSAPTTSMPGVTVVTPRRRLPKRLGGSVLTGIGLRRLTGGADLLWINDPEVGRGAWQRGQPAIYDVTDDWRAAPNPLRIQRRIARAETYLASRAVTVVCSEELRTRWQQRYGVSAPIVHNGIDLRAWSTAQPRQLPRERPAVGYIGTLHESRLDVEALLDLAAHPDVGSVHLVGPVALSAETRARLASAPKVTMHGAVPASEVPSWTVSMDLLVCPHVISPFTLSLDAIKSYEYLAAGRPVVATPTSGFQLLKAPQLLTVSPEGFTSAAVHWLHEAPPPVAPVEASWSERARQFRATWPV